MNPESKNVKKKLKSRVSIVLPTYNGVKYIRQSIDSCLNQTYRNIELIIVDDGSTDDTPEIIRSYKDKRMVYLKHKKNRGLPKALNTGFENTTGDYLTWTSDDNFYDKKAIEKMLIFLKKMNCDFVYCDFYRFDDKKPDIYRRLTLPDIPVLKKHNDIGPCFLYTREVMDIVGDYDENISLAEDYDYWIRVSKEFTLYHLAEPLYFYREHPRSLSFSKSQEIKVSDILVRVKNDVLELNAAAKILISIIEKKHPKIFGINKILTKHLFSRKIKKELNKFIIGEKPFKVSVKNLKNILLQNPFYLKILNLPYQKRLKENIRKIKNLFIKMKPVPKACSLFITNRCNFKCKGCRRSVLSVNNSKEMKLNTVKKLLSLYPSIKSFTLAGFGEPTLCKEFVDIVEFLKKEGKRVNIITNCTSIKKFLDLDCSVDQISVSLYGYNIDSYYLYTGLNAYKLVLENFLQLKGHFDNVGLSYIVTRKNYLDLGKIIQLCDKLKPNFLDLLNYLAYDITTEEEIQKIITVKDKKISEYIDKLCKSRDYIRIKPVYVDFEHPKFNCNSYDSRINLDGEGNIGGCMRQIPPDLSFGNVLKEKDPFNSREMKKLRRLQHTMEKTKKTPHKECNYCFGNWENK